MMLIIVYYLLHILKLRIYAMVRLFSHLYTNEICSLIRTFFGQITVNSCGIVLVLTNDKRQKIPLV